MAILLAKVEGTNGSGPYCWPGINDSVVLYRRANWQNTNYSVRVVCVVVLCPNLQLVLAKQLVAV